MTAWPTSNEERRRKILLTTEPSCKDEARIGQKTKITRPLRQAQEGQARHPASGAARSAHRLGLHLWRHLPTRGQGRGPRPAALQQRGDEPALGRYLPGG